MEDNKIYFKDIAPFLSGRVEISINGYGCDEYNFYITKEEEFAIKKYGKLLLSEANACEDGADCSILSIVLEEDYR